MNKILATGELLSFKRNDSVIIPLSQGPKDLAEKIYNIAIANVKHVYAIFIVDEHLMQFVAFEGKNGCGDFLYDDMQNVFECLKKIRKLQEVQSVWIQEMNRDTVDDVSNWNVCVQY